MIKLIKLQIIPKVKLEEVTIVLTTVNFHTFVEFADTFYKKKFFGNNHFRNHLRFLLSNHLCFFRKLVFKKGDLMKLLFEVICFYSFFGGTYFRACI